MSSWVARAFRTTLRHPDGLMAAMNLLNKRMDVSGATREMSEPQGGGCIKYLGVAVAYLLLRRLLHTCAAKKSREGEYVGFPPTRQAIATTSKEQSSPTGKSGLQRETTRRLAGGADLSPL